MSDWDLLAECLFPTITDTPDDIAARYPRRQLPEGARVTRIAPSPTGYLHLGTLYTGLVNRLTATATGGVFYFRLEDTDKKREIEGGADDILTGFQQYGIPIDEGFVAPGMVRGDYGPYQQSQRAAIYQTYVKDLVRRGLAYPCFCTPEALNAVRERQKSEKRRTGYYGTDAPCRLLSPEEAIRRVKEGHPYVMRLRSPGDETRKVFFDDLIKGKVEMPENDQDAVLLKSDGIPTYHFAHAVDDHLMGTTHVIRGDEWISSVPLHLQLFQILGFKPPKYAHVSPLMKEEDGGKRKLSKRKDPEAAVHFYAEQGYPADSVIEYLMTVAGSDFEDWRRCNPLAPHETFPFNLKKMSVSGALFDLNKLNDVSKNVIAGMNTETVTGHILEWAKVYDPAFYSLLARDLAYTAAIFAIDRDKPKPRKDMAKWSDAKTYAAYFFDELFDGPGPLPETVLPADAAAILTAYREAYRPDEDQQAWFETIKALCPALGYCPEAKVYRKDPTGYKGHAGDVSTVIRLAATGRSNTPDLCRILQLLGKERVLVRLDRAVAAWC